MSKLVESLKRLYDSGRRNKADMLDLLEKGSITDEEYRYITGEC